MAYYAMPYRGDEFGFPKELPSELPSSGFEGWIIQQGYPHSLIADIPGFPGIGWFCHCYDGDNPLSKFHPDNPNYLDPYDPANTSTSPEDVEDPEPEPVVATSFTTNTVST
jgi:hypothetical protein